MSVHYQNDNKQRLQFFFEIPDLNHKDNTKRFKSCKIPEGQYTDIKQKTYSKLIVNKFLLVLPTMITYSRECCIKLNWIMHAMILFMYIRAEVLLVLQLYSREFFWYPDNMVNLCSNYTQSKLMVMGVRLPIHPHVPGKSKYVGTDDLLGKSESVS